MNNVLEYDFTCELCGHFESHALRFHEYLTFSKACINCPDIKLIRPNRRLDGLPMISIPGSFTHDGIHKIVGTPNSRQTLIKPINLQETLPDGTVRVTRMGAKKDIENE